MSRSPRRDRRGGAARPTAAGTPTGRGPRSTWSAARITRENAPFHAGSVRSMRSCQVWPAGGGEHQRQHLGVARRGEPEALVEQFVAQRGGVHEVAVVGQRERAVHRLDEERLDVALGVRAGGRVAGVADRVVADERRQHLGREDVGDEPGLLVDTDPTAVAHRDPGRLLAAVLQREQTEERQLRDPVAVRRRDAEHAALVLRGVVVVERDRPSGPGVVWKSR